MIALSNIINSRVILDLVETLTFNFEASAYQQPQKTILFKH